VSSCCGSLAEIYNLKVKKPLAMYPLIPETVIQASAAEMFSHFVEISSKLFIHCATFLLATKVLTTKQLVSIYRHSHYVVIFNQLEMV
jgi:hypothetical protein